MLGGKIQERAMVNVDKEKCEPSTGEPPTHKAKQDAADRQSKALRQNLHRRKEQARARKLSNNVANVSNKQRNDSK